jgi:hypothetical protein
MTYYEYKEQKAKSFSEFFYTFLDNGGIALKNFGVWLRNEKKEYDDNHERWLAWITRHKSNGVMENIVVEKPIESKSDGLVVKTEDKKSKSFFTKLVDLYHAFLDKVKYGLHYLALALIVLAFITIVSFLLSGGKFHIFIRSISDIFERILKFFKNVFYSIMKGVVTLSPVSILNDVADEYEKMHKKIAEIFKKMQAAGINKSAFYITMGCLVGGFLIGSIYIEKELYGTRS